MKRKIVFDGISQSEAKKIKEELAEIFGVSTRSVSFALAFERNGYTAVKIREAALQKGGVLYELKAVAVAKPVKVLDRRGNVERTI